MTAQTHIRILSTPETTYYQGVLMPAGAALLTDILAITRHAILMGIMTTDQAFRVRVHAVGRYGFLSNMDIAVNTLCSILSECAAPGYEFTAWIIDGSRFWGWFPRTG